MESNNFRESMAKWNLSMDKLMLNPNLENSSSEYAAAVVYREAIHAYLNANGEYRDELIQHVRIAEEYITWISDAIIEAFPSLPRKASIALALGGLRKVMTNNPPYFDSLIQSYGFEDVNEVIALIEGYQNGTKGTACI